MSVVWTQEALERLEDIQYYLAVKQQAPIAAREMIERLLARTPQIEDMPLSGRQVTDYEDPNVREQLENPYRIIYQITDDTVYILSVMHQRQLLPKVKDLKATSAAAIASIESEQTNH